ncbi:EscU/YscU/HrcU family type III secretion system export apparatus switch protein [Asticcacaulis solisilvae]|uniref:EscU/YscU/HrcU family type III secretion system export apparatus switch protein n=1 Tax=Asticcacaulis solisilvae TaxID=1217274 RepID=UPI003FD783E1
MEEQSDQNKSEPPTPFKLSKAREKGSVARGLDLGFATSLIAFAGYLWMFGPGLAGSLSLAARRTLVTAPTLAAGPNESLQLIAVVLTTIAQPMLFLFGTVFVVVLVFEIVQTGFVFSLAPLSPEFSRLSPANGFKRIFSVRQLVETGKNVFKLAIYSALAVLVVLDARALTVPAIADAHGLVDALARASFRLLILFAGAAGLVAILDQLISRRDFFKRMRMTRQETRREARDREGDPRFKQRRRQVHREYAKLSKSLRNVRNADVLITNPTHYAVALSYDTATMTAPRVVAQGADQMALRLKRLAFLHGVVTIENRELARTLYHRCEIDREIPETCFRAVANIYRRLRRQSSLQTRA